MEGQISVYSKHKLRENQQPLKTEGAGSKTVQLPITRHLQAQAGGPLWTECV